ncbi:hypothetical protein AB4Z46_03865 [Variovorax sp. M-6]|uniref:hypothetical protein n=1 Tax=Variovorax sp. M-6 TaxID=3233041 RepID=UPI003F958AD5
MTTTSGAAAPSHRALLALSAIGTFSFLGWVLWFCRFGIDFRDEGFYLVSMSDPSKYDISVTQFGFIYHPLFALVRENVAAIRQVNLLITFGVAWALGNVALKACAPPGLRAGARLAISAALATASLSFLHIWLPTPSYNWLVLQALLIACIGLLMAEKTLDRGSLAGWLLIGVAGWLAFMAKPTSAAGLALCAVLYLIGAGKFALRPLILSAVVAVVLLLGSAWAIDGSIMAFVRRYQTGIALAELMGGGHKLSLFLRLGDLQLERPTRNILLGSSLVLALVAWLLKWDSKAAARAGYAGLWLMGLGALAIVCGFARQLLTIEYYRGLLLVAVPFAALILVGLGGWRRLSSVPRARWSLILLLFVLPYVYVFGTVNNYWWQISHAAFFWVLAAAVLVLPVGGEPARSIAPVLLAVALGAQLITVAIVQTGIEAPYGQAVSLRDNHRKVSVGRPNSTLRLSNGFGAYLADAAEVANRVGFARGTPMLDLTGRSPSTLYTMGASSTSQAWVIGGYPGSNNLAAAMMKRVSCDELSRAWLLTQPVGTTNISPEILSGFGANLKTDYEIVGTVVMSESFSGYREHWTQHLLKPTRGAETARAACVAARSGNT